VIPFYVGVVLRLCLSRINLSCQSVDNLLVKTVCGGLFHFSVSDFYNKSMNNICDGINESIASIWYSRLCHLNFDSMSRLSSLNLILN
jgi:hypothetical protein